MVDDGHTRPSLLIRVRDPRDDEAWQQFAELYGPLIYRFARKRRLQDADAQDLTQVVLDEVSRAIRGLDYDPRKGTFRGWLFSVVRNHLAKWQARQRRVTPGSGDSGVQQVLEDQPGREDESEWDEEYQRQVFLWAAERVRPAVEVSSWQVFWRTAVEGEPPGETAAALSMSLGAVYTAKSRVLDRIRKEIQKLQDD